MEKLVELKKNSNNFGNFPSFYLSLHPLTVKT